MVSHFLLTGYSFSTRYQIAFHKIYKTYICFFLCILLLPFAWLSSGCDVMTYNGKHEDLASATIHSIPGTQINRESRFLELDEDQYGRRLFSVYLPYSCLSTVLNGQNNYNPPAVAILIVQKIEKDYIYFYAEDNYKINLLSAYLTLSEENVKKQFGENVINELKVNNDWNEPTDSSRMLTRVPVRVEKTIVIPNSANQIIEEKLGTTLCRDWFRSDANGKHVIFVEKAVYHESNITGYDWYFVLFDSEWELLNGDSGIYKITGLDTMAQELKAFLAASDWIEITGGQ